MFPATLSLLNPLLPPLPPNSNPNSHPPPSPTQTLTLLQRCETIEQLHQIHASVLKTNLSQHPLLLSKLLHFSSSLSSSSSSYCSQIFHTIENPDVYHYTFFIAANLASRSNAEAIRVYCRMVSERIVPDVVVASYVLRACGLASWLRVGRQVHGQVVKLKLVDERLVLLRLIELYARSREFRDAELMFDKMLQRDAVAATALVSCYSDCGMVGKARAFFDRVGEKDTVCWTAMINGLVRNGRANAALELFREMQRENVRPNEVTVVCVLSACSQLGALGLGRWVHSYVGKHGIRLNTFVGATLIDMYAKCGSLEEAKEVFDVMPDKDVVSYNSMIVGLAMNGRSSEAVELFRRMVGRGMTPNHITFVGVLNACSHGGLVDLGFQVFESMGEIYGLEPRIEHCGCMVDLLGRVGRLEEAYEFICQMRIEPDHVIWGALLSSCKLHKNLCLGEKVAEFLMNSEAADSGTYVLLANTYASLGKWKEAAVVRAKMKERGIQKEPGCSSIEVDDEMHEFLLGDIRHPQRDEIYQKLDELNDTLKSEGYFPAKDLVLHDIEEGEKEWALSIHSERLAICFGLIATKPGTTIRVVKNLRVCNDCHSMIKLVSKVTKRSIVVRDRNRFHHFEDGLCSCRDYW